MDFEGPDLLIVTINKGSEEKKGQGCIWKASSQAVVIEGIGMKLAGSEKKR